MKSKMLFTLLLVLGAGVSALRAENAMKPEAEPGQDLPTLHCLGFYWLVRGDDNANGRVEVYYRAEGQAEFKRGPDLFRLARHDGVYKCGREKPHPEAIKVPSGAWLFAGTIFSLQPDTAYEVKLKLADPDGGADERTLKARTIAEPAEPKDLQKFHVAPGSGGGDGTEQNPFKGIAAAQAAARPGTLFLLHAGTYAGEALISKSGDAGKPIVWRGAGDGETILSGDTPDGATIQANGIHDVWFENLTVTNAFNLMKVHKSHNLVVRRCHFTKGVCGIFGTVDPENKMGRFFISDNLFEGVTPGLTTKEEYAKVPESRAVWLAGCGNIICYNEIHHFKDGVDMANCGASHSNDVHNNDIHDLTDDGGELDGSDRNSRFYCNRITNVWQGISFQPVYGGPVYAYRNVMYNVAVEPFKLHCNPWGAIMIHNTIVRKGDATCMYVFDPIHNNYSRNNLYLGTKGRLMYYSTKTNDSDFDYDGLGCETENVVFTWQDKNYSSIEDVRAKCPVEKNFVRVDPATAFASGLVSPGDWLKKYDYKTVDLRLKEGTAAIDSGAVLPGLNDNFAGKAPDLGAYEFGSELPHYGVREKKQ